MNESHQQQELEKELYDAVVAMDEERVQVLSTRVLTEGLDARSAVRFGLMAAMEKAAQLYSSEVYYVSELLLCADALQAGLRILGPHVAIDGSEDKKQMLIGTVEGDIHDVGKNIVRIMFESTGWTVHDLGKDVPPDKFVEEQRRTGADVIALSALMSTTMLAIPKAIRVIKGEYPHVPVIVGGAPLTRDIAMAYGADGYADNAGEAITEVGALLRK